MLHYRRIAVIVLIVAIAFGAGLGLAQAQPADDWCLDQCEDGCTGHGGCDSSQAYGCNCIYFCKDEHPGEAYCAF